MRRGTAWFCCIGTALGRQKAEMFEDISCRTSMVAGFSVAFCWTAGPPTGRHNFRMLISRAGRRCSSRYSRYGVSTSSIHFMNARTRRDRLLRCATTRDTASARRRKSGMISTSAPLSKCPSGRFASLLSLLAGGLERLESSVILSLAPIREVPHVDDRKPSPVRPGQAALPK